MGDFSILAEALDADESPLSREAAESIRILEARVKSLLRCVDATDEGDSLLRQYVELLEGMLASHQDGANSMKEIIEHLRAQVVSKDAVIALHAEKAVMQERLISALTAQAGNHGVLNA